MCWLTIGTKAFHLQRIMYYFRRQVAHQSAVGPLLKAAAPCCRTGPGDPGLWLCEKQLISPCRTFWYKRGQKLECNRRCWSHTRCKNKTASGAASGTILASTPTKSLRTGKCWNCRSLLAGISSVISAERTHHEQVTRGVVQGRENLISRFFIDECGLLRIVSVREGANCI